jgi:hypothetical protein
VDYRKTARPGRLEAGSFAGGNDSRDSDLAPLDGEHAGPPEREVLNLARAPQRRINDLREPISGVWAAKMRLGPAVRHLPLISPDLGLARGPRLDGGILERATKRQSRS